MKIDSSMIGMESARSYTSRTNRTVATNLAYVTAPNQGSARQENLFSDFLNAGKQEDAAATQSKSTQQVQSRFNSYDSKISPLDEKNAIQSIREQCVMFLIRWLFDSFGTRGAGGSRYAQQPQSYSFENGFANASLQDLQSSNTIVLQPRTLETSINYHHEEQEQTSFTSKGYVRTADGREISFNMDISMSRRFEETYQAKSMMENIKMTDPLVINLNQNIAGLSDQKFEFDLDCDGIKENISTLNGGNGFLALDLNGDGIINDGSELFGTKSGDGFADLAKYDEDGNGWIDENDEIFDKLLVWAKTEDGQDELYTLKEAGVGAICLQRANTEFSLNSLHNNQTNGVIRSTGMFLYENGNVGTVQQLDLAQ